MLSTKKAQGMSLNTIIIAIIVLIVLVVLVMIFTGYFGRVFTPGVQSCATQGGECTTACNTGAYGAEIGSAADCRAKSQVCCVKGGVFQVFGGGSAAASAPPLAAVAPAVVAAPAGPASPGTKGPGEGCSYNRECKSEKCAGTGTTKTCQ